MNMMKYCPECYKELPPNSAVCPYCGYRTGNGDDNGHEEEAPKIILQTPKVDSYLPPEQTLLGFLLVMIFFWGFNITAAVLPFFIDAATKRNLLIALISSQVITRTMIGIWAVEEVSLKNKPTITAKLGAFLLAFIPLAAIYSSLHAARTVIRKDRVSILSIASIATVIMMALVLFRTSDQIRGLIAGVDFNNLSAVTTLLPDVIANPGEEGEGGAATNQDETPATGPTDTPKPYINGCRNPRSVTADEEFDFLEVCGEITNFGVRDCDNCPLGYYSYLKLDGKFQIVSYEWRFTHAWLKKCVRVEDTLQLLGGIPAFVFNVGEGCIGDCVHDFHGGLIDDGGVYFQPFDGCD